MIRKMENCIRSDLGYWMPLSSDRLRQNIISLLKNRRVSGAVLARTLGVTHAAVSRWLSGDSAPSWEYVDKIAVFFDVEIKDLFDDPDHPKPIKKSPLDIDAIDALKIIARELGHEIRRRPVRKPADEMPEK